MSDLDVTELPRGRRAARPALKVDAPQLVTTKVGIEHQRRVLMVDLNNFASFPTLAIGLLVASLRNRGHEVQVICPLSHDVPAAFRERRETLLDHMKRRVHLSTFSPFLGIRDQLREIRSWWKERPHPIVLREVTKALDQKPDILLLSAYLQHFASIREISELARQRGIPVILGGPMFNLPDTVDAWRTLPGITAVVGSEADRDICPLVETACERGDLLQFAGVTLNDGRRGAAAGPLRNLDATPIPDFSDFPWDRYPVRIIPLMTGRGCQWDKCLFCSDVISASGRTFRTRSLDHVLLEMQEQARRYDTSNFLFLDLKLNSYSDMIRGIASEIQSYVQGAEWVGTVHVDLRRDNGLSRDDLRTAVRGGMRRISFGLETGSQRLLDLMQKGSSVEANEDFIRNAHEAGLSVRCTMFKGFPGETSEDMAATANFLEKHARYLDRVRFNEFSLLQDTPIFEALVSKSAETSPLEIKAVVEQRARAEYRHRAIETASYRREKSRALRAVYEINRRPLRAAARQFDGLM